MGKQRILFARAAHRKLRGQQDTRLAKEALRVLVSFLQETGTSTGADQTFLAHFWDETLWVLLRHSDVSVVELVLKITTQLAESGSFYTGFDGPTFLTDLWGLVAIKSSTLLLSVVLDAVEVLVRCSRPVLSFVRERDIDQAWQVVAGKGDEMLVLRFFLFFLSLGQSLPGESLCFFRENRHFASEVCGLLASDKEHVVAATIEGLLRLWGWAEQTPALCDFGAVLGQVCDSAALESLADHPNPQIKAGAEGLLEGLNMGI